MNSFSGFKNKKGIFTYKKHNNLSNVHNVLNNNRAEYYVPVLTSQILFAEYYYCSFVIAIISQAQRLCTLKWVLFWIN